MSGIKFMGKDPNGLAKAINVDENGSINTVALGDVIDNTKIYKEGTEIIPWEVGRAVGQTATFTKETDHIYLFAENSIGVAEVSAVTSNLVDLTNVFNIEIDWEKAGADANSKVYFGVSQLKTTDYTILTKSLFITKDFSRKKTILDVSNLIGEYYIRVHAVDGSGVAKLSEVKIYNVTLLEFTTMENLPLRKDELGLPFIPVKNQGNCTVYQIYGKFSVGTIAITKEANMKVCTINVLSGRVWVNPNFTATADANSFELSGTLDMYVSKNLSLVSDDMGASVQILVWE